MKWYVDGEKKNTAIPVESVEETSYEPPVSNGHGGFKPIKIYVDGGKTSSPDSYERTDDTYVGGLDDYGTDGFRTVVSKTEVREEQWIEPEKERIDTPIIPEKYPENKADTGKLKVIVAVLVAACICVIVFASGGQRQPNAIVKTVSQTGVVRETAAPAKAFSDDPAAIQAASESVVIIYVYDNYGTLMSLGSGFACFENNLIVTNYHVIEGAGALQAVTEDGQIFEILRSNEYQSMDVAILTTQMPHNLPLLQLGDSTNMLKGEKVVAIGSPDGLMNSVSDGVFSRYNSDGLIQMTATIWHGSSGGALFNDQGEVIGITSGGLEGQGINFAVPIEHAVQLYREGMNLY